MNVSIEACPETVTRDDREVVKGECCSVGGLHSVNLRRLLLHPT